MILSVSNPDGSLSWRREISAADLAQAFWASSWGRSALQAGSEPSVALLSYLTAPAAQGGLQASWTDNAGLHEALDLIVATRPPRG